MDHIKFYKINGPSGSQRAGGNVFAIVTPYDTDKPVAINPCMGSWAELPPGWESKVHPISDVYASRLLGAWFSNSGGSQKTAWQAMLARDGSYPVSRISHGSYLI